MTEHPIRIIPLILSGGAGSRLWPLSRKTYPKQLLPLVTGRTMLQETVLRVAGRAECASPMVVCNQDHRFAVAEQLRQIGISEARIVLEPCARNTAPAIATAARIQSEQDGGSMLLVLPADHHIADPEAFFVAVMRGAELAAEGALVTFGIEPNLPHTGYGYLKVGEALGASGAYKVGAFVEKPDLARAERMLAEGGHLWNSGIFLFRVDAFLEELKRFEPEIAQAVDQAVTGAVHDLDFLRLDGAAFARSPSISVDYAIMERTSRAVVVPVTAGWTDVGSWSALWDVSDRDPEGNVAVGDVHLEGARNCYVRTDGILTGVVGLQDAVVVVTKDAVLVAGKDHGQEVKTLVERLEAVGRQEVAEPRIVHRPWGSYECIHAGHRFQVKSITVKPGRKLSLQKHFHRAEHWVVVTGTAMVTRDEETFLVRENESVYMPLGCVHRLENPGKLPLTLIEVQSGAYLGEDDIVRIEDDYRRVSD